MFFWIAETTLIASGPGIGRGTRRRGLRLGPGAQTRPLARSHDEAGDSATVELALGCQSGVAAAGNAGRPSGKAACRPSCSLQCPMQPGRTKRHSRPQHISPRPAWRRYIPT